MSHKVLYRSPKPQQASVPQLVYKYPAHVNGLDQNSKPIFIPNQYVR